MPATVGEVPQQCYGLQLLQLDGGEGDLVHPVEGVAHATRRAKPIYGVGGHEDRILEIQLGHQRDHGRVDRKAAVPVGLTVDLYGLEELRKAGRGE